MKKIEKKIENGSAEWKMFKWLYIIFQKFGEPEERESYWEELAQTLDQFYEKCPISAAKHFGIALAETLEEEYKRMHKQDKKREGIAKES